MFLQTPSTSKKQYIISCKHLALSKIQCKISAWTNPNKLAREAEGGEEAEGGRGRGLPALVRRGSGRRRGGRRCRGRGRRGLLVGARGDSRSMCSRLEVTAAPSWCREAGAARRSGRRRGGAERRVGAADGTVERRGDLEAERQGGGGFGRFGREVTKFSGHDHPKRRGKDR